MMDLTCDSVVCVLTVSEFDSVMDLTCDSVVFVLTVSELTV